jgi:hypothetical protein
MEKLQELGLTYEEAVESLELAKGDINRAVEYHFANMTRKAKSSWGLFLPQAAESNIMLSLN